LGCTERWKVRDRSVATDALETLGTIIDVDQRRDAIHLAVDPVEAGEKLYPAQDIGLSGGKAWAAGTAIKPLGVVDPFLKTPVFPGQRFWLVIYPRKINSLRHVWSHPDIPDVPELLPPLSKVAFSEAWLRDYISKAGCPGYDETIHGAIDAAENGEDYVFFSGRDAHGEIPKEFWDHLEVLTGRKFAFRPTGFSCSC
jgi:hypothetical protein